MTIFTPYRIGYQVQITNRLLQQVVNEQCNEVDEVGFRQPRQATRYIIMKMSSDMFWNSHCGDKTTLIKIVSLQTHII